MKRLFPLLAICFLSPLLSKALVLDEVMSKEDQKRTGVAYLSTNQRIALEQWINQNCNCPSRIAPTEQENNLFVSINIDSGRKIQLNDNSIWDVDPKDYNISEAWLSSIPVKIVPSYDPDYPCLLVNRNTGVSIKVRKGQAPASTPHTTPTPAETQTPSTKTPQPAPAIKQK
jgi:hypothetical protein